MEESVALVFEEVLNRGHSYHDNTIRLCREYINLSLFITNTPIIQCIQIEHLGFAAKFFVFVYMESLAREFNASNLP